MKMNLTHKIGPLPVWAWGAVGGLAVYWFFIRSKASKSTSSTGSGVLDPNAIDPNTGLTYGQEESAAALSPTTGGLGSSGGSSGGTTGPDATGFDTAMQGLLGALQDFSSVAQALGLVPASSQSATTQAAISSEPMKHKAHPPTTKASAHTQGVKKIETEAEAALHQARAAISSIGRAPAAIRDANRAHRLLQEARKAKNPHQARKLANEAKKSADKARAAAAATAAGHNHKPITHHPTPRPRPRPRRRRHRIGP